MSSRRSSFIEALLVTLIVFVSTESLTLARTSSAERERVEAARIQDELIHPKTPDVTGRAVRGNPDAAVLIVTYSDFQCPYCRRSFNVIEKLRKKYGDQVRFAFKHMPLPNHVLARPAATYFEAIAMQDPKKAYTFHDELFLHPARLDREGKSFADEVIRKLKVDYNRVQKDAKSAEVKKRLDADVDEAAKFGFVGTTPCFVVGGITLRGALPASIFEAIIDKRLAEAKAPKGEPAPVPSPEPTNP